MTDIEQLLENLDSLETQLIEVEETVPEAFQSWYKLTEARNDTINKIRGLIREMSFEGNSKEYGKFRIARCVKKVVDISKLRKEVPSIFSFPGVVKGVDIKALLSAISAGSVNSKEAKQIEACITEEDDTPKVYGPKAVEL